jgi:hypothetical protein
MANQNTNTKCSETNCLLPVKVRGYCKLHYKNAWRKGAFVITPRPVYDPICIVEDCNSPQDKKGYCQKHYRRIQRFGTLELTRQPIGSLVNSGGYLSLRINGIRKLHHVRVAEKALGKPLPKGAEVHHVNEIKSDNRGENLVICPDRAYHMILHARQRAYDACGHADWQKCGICKKYDDPKNISASASRGVSVNRYYHKKCAAEYVRNRKRIRKSLNRPA